MKRTMVQYAAALLAVFSLAASPMHAQVTTIDPNDAIDADLDQGAEDAAAEAQTGLPNIDGSDSETLPEPDALPTELPEDEYSAETSGAPVADAPGQEVAQSEGSRSDDTTFQRDDLIGAAEGVFGKGAEGLARIIEDILKDQGQPNGYIVGREAGGAFIMGIRYGSGTLYHKVEGQLPVYWTGPSIGVDAGANAANSFTLVYNLYDTDELYKRYGAGEGAAYLVGGFNASYLRRKDVVLIPIRLGVGVRLGANIGYRKFSKKQRWLPF